jgi:hypothetical protein
MARKILFSILFGLMIISPLLFADNVLAACNSATSTTGCIDSSSLPQSSLLTNPGSSTISTILALVFSIIGAIAVIIIVLAGFTYITSKGEPEKTAKAKDTILYAVIGLIVAILATTIVGFVAGYL